MAKGGKAKDGRPPGDGETGFEESLARLEEIVAELEGSDVPLERALTLFEEGVRIGRTCGSRLDAAERRITMLLEQVDGTLVEQPFDAEAATPAPPTPRPRSAPAAPRKPAVVDDDDDDSIPF